MGTEGIVSQGTRWQITCFNVPQAIANGFILQCANVITFLVHKKRSLYGIC